MIEYFHSPARQRLSSWEIQDFVSRACRVRGKGYYYLIHAITTCFQEPVYLEKTRDLYEKIAVWFMYLKGITELDNRSVKAGLQTAVNQAWKNYLHIYVGEYPPPPFAIDEFISRSIKALTTTTVIWEQQQILWEYKDF